MSDLIMYQTEDGLTKIEVEFDNENAWLTQAQMAELSKEIERLSLSILRIFLKKAN